MSFWKQQQKLLLQRWEIHRRPIEREVAERRRDLVRRNLRQSSEWSRYEPYTDWYLEREVEAFVAAVDEVTAAGHYDIDDESLDEMDRMLAEIIDRRRQLAPAEALRADDSQPGRVKGLARVGLLQIQSQRRAERERGAAPAPQPPVRRAMSEAPAAAPIPASPESAAEAPGSGASTATTPPASVERGAGEARRLTENLRRLAQISQRLPDPEEQAESLEELQFVAEEATAEPDARKLRMVAAALERITARLAAAGADEARQAAALAEPIQRWFGV